MLAGQQLMLKLNKMENLNKLAIESLGCKINERDFKNLKNYFSKKPYNRFKFDYSDDEVLYLGTEYKHFPKYFPHITVLPHFRTLLGDRLLGSTMGHQHLQWQEFRDGRRFQEIYEFLNHGGMLIRNREGATLYFLRPKEKVVVGTDDNMTIFNFSGGELVTHDYANHSINMNKANKDTEDSIGSLLTGKFTPGVKGLTFYVNEDYKRRGLLHGHEAVVYLSCSLEEDLFDYVGSHPDCFEGTGITSKIGGNLPDDLKRELDRSLLQLIQERNPTLLDILKMPSDVLFDE